MDKSSSTYHLQADDGRLLPIKKGNIQWDDTVKFCNYIDVFFQPNAVFTKQENWEKRMRQQFDNWQEQRQHLEIDPEFELPKDTTLDIIHPKTICTLVINIPVQEMKDKGNPIKLHDEVIKIFKYHNHQEKKKGGNKIIPIEHIKSVNRSKKNKETIGKVINKWNEWKQRNLSYYNKQDRHYGSFWIKIEMRVYVDLVFSCSGFFFPQ